MIQEYILCTLILFTVARTNAQISIEETRSMNLGQTVTVEGIIINGSELGVIRYLQDETAGIAAYPGNGSIEGFSENVNTGDRVRITGELSDFNDLLEITPITAFEVISSDNILPDPISVTIDDIGKSNEGQLIQINCLSFGGAGSLKADLNGLTDVEGNQIQLYFRNGHPLIGESVPETPVNVIAISSVFRQPQILIRTLDDLIPTNCLSFTEIPYLEEFSTDHLSISWATNEAGAAGVKYGTTPELDQQVQLVNATLEHTVDIPGLEPGTIYYTQAITYIGSDSLLGPVQVYATVSNSSGDMKVYFNNEVESSISTGIAPAGTSGQDIVDALIERIQTAQLSIEVSSYNNNFPQVINELEAAVNRGVQVRFIANDGSSNSALNRELPFPVIYGNEQDLMHNKFFVFDADDEMNSYVWTGSTNMSDQQIYEDPNNVVLIQDQSLSRTYRLEFNEMWGTDKLQPVFTNSKFGNEKEDNTPHFFLIGGKNVECYFSPSDDPTDHIVEALLTTDYEVAFALLSFTRNEIGTTLVNLHNEGKTVRGIINNIGDSGSEYQYLIESGIDVGSHPSDPLFHHKYAIIDGFYESSDPTVITGSHNWTTAAERDNDENYLVIHDASIANQFLQEFTFHYQQELSPVELLEDVDIQFGPNPFNGHLSITSNEIEITKIHILDLYGRMVHHQTYTHSVDLSHLSAGTYVLRLLTNQGIINRKIIKQ